MADEWTGQGGWVRRFEWGQPGVVALSDAAVTVVVDVLRFTTAVEAAVSAGVVVIPCPLDRDLAADLARTAGAVVADGSHPDGPSLSPVRMARLAPGTRVVLPSPNGSACAHTASKGSGVVAAACLRNAAAVAQWAAGRLADAPPGGRSIAVVAAGERWPDGSLRPAFEDLVGAGAVLSRLPGPASPEAESAVAAFEAARPRLAELVAGCASGRELLQRGMEEDVTYATQLDASACVPVVSEGAFDRGDRSA